MNYDKIGARVRTIREKDLKKSREEFAEEIGVSTTTIARLENSTSKVSNLETFIKISEISGYSLDEIVLDKNDNIKTNESLKKRINYFLNTMSKDELEYTLSNISNFVKFSHKDKIKTLKDIKNNLK